MNSASLRLLKEIIAATQNAEQGFLYTSTEHRAELINHIDGPLVEANSDMTEPTNTGNLATRATQKGLNFMATEETTDFEIENNVPMPKPIRKSNKAKYPIDQLKIGQCFHIGPNGDEDIDAIGKRMAAVVSNANQRHRASKNPPENKVVSRKSRKTGEVSDVTIEIMVQLRKFTARRVSADDPKGVGLRIYRVDIDA